MMRSFTLLEIITVSKPPMGQIKWISSNAGGLFHSERDSELLWNAAEERQKRREENCHTQALEVCFTSWLLVIKKERVQLIFHLTSSKQSSRLACTREPFCIYSRVIYSGDPPSRSNRRTNYTQGFDKDARRWKGASLRPTDRPQVRERIKPSSAPGTGEAAKSASCSCFLLWRVFIAVCFMRLAVSALLSGADMRA